MTEPDPSHDVNNAPSRHWLYGVNAGLLVLVGIMILVFLMVAADRKRGVLSWDMTSNGANSLSGSTKKLLKDINDRKLSFHVVSLFTDPSNEEKSAGDPNKQAEKREQVMDLLNLYRNNSSQIQVDDWGDKARDDIDREIRDKYAGELKPYEKAVKDFDQVAQELRTFSQQEAEQIAVKLQQAKATQDEMDAAGSLQTKLRQMPSMLDDLQDDIHDATDETLPEWNHVTDAIKDQIDGLEAGLAMLSDPEKIKALKLPAALTAYFSDASDRYKKIVGVLKPYLDELNALKPLKVEDILSGVGRNTIVVLGPDSAKVLHMRDLYQDAPLPQDAPPTASAATIFKGEEEISSALLAMARPEKVKVVFVTPAPQQLTTDRYSEITKQLQQANFDVLEWSPPGAQQSPDDPSSATPPAEGKGVVWVVFPPASPSGEMAFLQPPPDPKPVIAAVRKHMDEGGRVMFLAEASSASLMGGGDTYAYDDLIKGFGVEVKPKYTVVDETDTTDETTGQREMMFKPYIDVDTYEDQDITNPLKTLHTAFFPTKSVTVVDIAKNPPSDAHPKIIVKTPYAAEYWGETNFSAEPKFDPQDDYAPPVPMAAVSVLHPGKPDEQRIVVIGTRYIADNAVIQAQPAMLSTGQIVGYVPFPGNQELMKNSILWLAGYENMIAVSANTNLASRFDVTPTELIWLRILAAIILPVVALVLGGFIWMSRHR